jgi:hypothetical protein
VGRHNKTKGKRGFRVNHLTVLFEAYDIGYYE